MLKIKDDVPIEELTKSIGFEYDKKAKKYCLKNRFGYEIAEIIPDNWFQGSRGFNIYGCSTEAIDLLYDLIQAGLVEKVSD